MTLDAMLLHPQTQSTLKRLSEHPGHGYIFHGTRGAGKYTAALVSIAQRHKDYRHLILENNWEYLHVVKPLKDKRSIGIDQIKNIDQYIQLAHSHDTYVVIDDADSLTTEAQNAFLKTLEEPPAHIHIIMVVHDEAKIVTTIHSRTQHVPFLHPPKVVVRKHLDGLSLDPKAANLILNISQGLPGKAIALATDKEAFGLAEQRLEQARVMLGAPLNERLLLVNSLNKEQSLEVLDYTKTMIQAALRSTAGRNDAPKTQQWSQKATVVLRAIEYLQKNANQRLVMTDLVLNL